MRTLQTRTARWAKHEPKADMEANQRQQVHLHEPDQAISEAAKTAMMERHDLSHAAKRGLPFLFDKAGHKFGMKFVIHAADLGASVGARDPLGTGKNILKAVEKTGIATVTKIKKGLWQVEFIHSGRCAESLKVIVGDPQARLFASEPGVGAPGIAAFDPDALEQLDFPPDVPPDLPPAHMSCENVGGAQIGMSHVAGEPRAYTDIAGGRSGPSSGERSSLPTGEDLRDKQKLQRDQELAGPAKPLNTVLIETLQTIGRRTKEDDENFAERILSIIADPSQSSERCQRVACFANGHAPLKAEVEVLLRKIRNKFGDDPAKASDRGKYFNFEITRICRKLQIDLGKPKPPATDEPNVPF